MTNVIKQPLLNPLKFVEISPANIPQYVSKHIDDWLFYKTIRSYQQPTNYINQWVNDDSIRNQYTSNYSPLSIKLFSCDGKFIESFTMDTRQQDFFNPGYYIRQTEIDLQTFDPGYYYFTIPEANLISELLEICETKEDAPNTLYIEYSNTEMYGGVIFDSPFSPTLRIPGILRFKTPNSRDTIYVDQDEGDIMLKSVPSRIWQLIVAGPFGVPPFLIDKVNRILGCSDVKIDGKYYSKSLDSSAWEPVEVEDDQYPLAGWSIDVREKFNEDSLTYENDSLIIGQRNIMAVMDNKGFGVEDSGDDFLEMLDVN